MDYEVLFTQLQQHAHAIQALTRGLSPDDARWKPDADAWSVLKVINHLYDEERRDFRVRLDIILHRPHEAFPHINPPQWVIDEKYSERELDTSVQDFLDERAASLRWLTGLAPFNQDATHTGEFGTVTAGEMFSAWVAHDVLHLRQLVELHYALVQKHAAPFILEYAGAW